MSKTSFERFMPVVLVAVVGLAFLVGMLWQKVTNLEGGGAKKTNPPSVVNNDIQADGKLSDEQIKKIPSVSESDHVFGSKDADVFLIEYSDFECPFCVRFHPTAKQAVNEYKGKVAWVYRHFPLETLHPRAYPSAIASECVSDTLGNDAFWKYIDVIFSGQEKYLTDAGLREAAVSLGMDGGKFDSCYQAKESEKDIRDVASKGGEAGVTGTPATFVVNKKGDAWLVSGAVQYDSLKASIDEALKN